MKKMKILTILFILSCFIPLMNTMAATGSLGIFGVTIPKNADDWYYTGFGNVKTQYSAQFYHNGGAINNLDLKCQYMFEHGMVKIILLG